MDHFSYHDGQLMCEGVAADELVQRFGSPLYVYSKATLLHHFDALTKAFAPLSSTICYSIKSCQNIALCKLLAERGCGMDVVSGGEVHRAKLAGADMSKVVYAGVGKTDSELRLALDAGVGYFNIESEAEFENLSSIAADMGVVAHAALRVNPDVSDPRTHAKTTTGSKETKFGVDHERALSFFDTYGNDANVKLDALHLHIGSPIYSAEPYARAIDRATQLIDQLESRGHTIRALDMGGGFGADYHSGATPGYEDYAGDMVPKLLPLKQRGIQIIFEPGRTLAANAGLLLTQVQYIKVGGSKTFAIVDTGMHHLIRPTLYDAFHFIWPTKVATEHAPQMRCEEPDMPGLVGYDIVGPICETGDYLALDRAIPPVERGDNIAIFSAGAYGMVMASNYNTMPRPAEVLVDGDIAAIIRRRETYDDLVEPELNAER